MDEIVQQALAKWPNVPHCYGWLALDARGNWRMRDERAQALNLPGDKIVHPALLGFIRRNYACDARGCWYFQNGPQRVYVDLEATPYIARTDPEHGFLDQTGSPLTSINAAWLTESGQLVVQCAEKIAQLDDRDLAQCILQMQIDGEEVGEAALVAWLDAPSEAGSLRWRCIDHVLSVQHIMREAIAKHFGFVCRPRPEEGGT